MHAIRNARGMVLYPFSLSAWSMWGFGHSHSSWVGKVGIMYTCDGKGRVETSSPVSLAEAEIKSRRAHPFEEILVLNQFEGRAVRFELERMDAALR